MPKPGYDFSGWASWNDMICDDGKIIRKDAFASQDGDQVSLVYNHGHEDIKDVIGHAILENRDQGVYAYGYINDTDSGKHAKECLKHGDVKALSIWANNLDKRGNEILHGVIREVSLVLAGSNPGAFIESVIAHGFPMDDDEDEGIIFTGKELAISHSAMKDEKEKEEKPMADKKEKMKEDKEKSVKEVLDTLNEEQKEAVAIAIKAAVRTAKVDDEEEEDDDVGVKHSIFDRSKDSNAEENKTFISHSDMEAIVKEAKKCGSFREAVSSVMELEEGDVIAHSIDTTGMTTATGTQTYGFNDPSMLFPEPKALAATPEFISRNMTWVQKFMSQVHRTPFSRVKSVYANITEDEARAKGYIKGKQKKEEVFTTLKRVTTPQMIYKLQKLDREDILDITDFSIIPWLKNEMLIMLNEELARAMLIGDGRLSDSEDKIKEENVRPIAKDVPLFNAVVKVSVDADADQAVIAKATVDAIIRSRKLYKGSGSPTFWSTEDAITEMLMLEDGIGHKIYKSEAEVATVLRVREVVPVEPMEGHNIEISGKSYPLIGVIVNPADYNVGSDPQADSNDILSDFDIDFNQYKYLLEKRMSGALIKPFSAITVVLDRASA